MDECEIETVEIELLLEAIHRVYGFDFREYAFTSLRRRIHQFLSREGIGSVSQLQDKILRSSTFMDRFVIDVTVNVSAHFRDPELFAAIRTHVVPVLRTHPFLRIWHAGCSMGEEVYSLAILLHEEGLYDRSRIYATDINPVALHKAREGVYNSENIDESGKNYIKSGGKYELNRYFRMGYGNIVFSEFLKENLVFSQHNLCSDSSFNEFHMILCRNVLIYFKKSLQDRVLCLLDSSLISRGWLALGQRESLILSPLDHKYLQIQKGVKLYRRLQ